MTLPEDRVREIDEFHRDRLASPDPDTLERITEGAHDEAFGLGRTAHKVGIHALLLGDECWDDYLAKGARYRLRGLSWFEADRGTTKPTEYDRALCGALLSGRDDVVEATFAGIRAMPDAVHDAGGLHGAAVRDTLRCLAVLHDAAGRGTAAGTGEAADTKDPRAGDGPATGGRGAATGVEGVPAEGADRVRAALDAARETVAGAAAEGGLRLVGSDREPRFRATFAFVEGALDGDRAAVAGAVEDLLDWHRAELFEGATTDHVADWAGAYVALAARIGFEVRPDDEYLPAALLDAVA